MKQIKLLNTVIATLILIGINNVAFSSEGKLDSLLNVYNKSRADKAFEKMAYIKAIDIYAKLIESDYIHVEVYRNIAEACLKVGKTKEAEEYFLMLINTTDYNARDVYLYAQTLKYNGKYIESDKWMQRFAQMDKSDSRAARQKNSFKLAEELKSLKLYKIENVKFNSKYADFGPAMNGDKLYFASERRVDEIINYQYSWKEAPYNDIYEVNLNGIVTKPTLFEGKVNSKFHDGPACFSADGEEMFFTRNNSYFRMISKSGKNKVNNFKIYYTKKQGDDLTTPIELPFNSEDYSCGHPSLTADGKTLYFSSDMPGGFGGSDIYMVKRTNNVWSDPINLGPEINTEGNEMFPFIQSDVLYFSSNGHYGLGGLDIYKAEQKSGKYTVENMGYPMNTNSDDFSMIIDSEGKAGYFASNREGGKGDDDIYKFEKLDVSLHLLVKVYNSKTKERIINPKISFNNKVIVATTEHEDIDADFTYKVLPGEVHSLLIAKEGYFAFNQDLNISELNKDGAYINYDVYLEPEPEWGIYGKVFYKEDLQEIPNVKIHIENLSNSFIKTYLSDSSGLFKIKLDKETNYKLMFEKEDIFAIRAEYSTVDRDSGWVNVNEFVELAFEKIELNKTIEIPNIYYDLGKWNIREDAAVELDKVVQFLIDNPTIQIELGSHTDARGSSKSNQWLSQKRAQSAVDYIVKHGISEDRITAKGYGEEKIKNRCVDGVKCSEAEHQENRRTEIRITGIK